MNQYTGETPLATARQQVDELLRALHAAHRAGAAGRDVAPLWKELIHRAEALNYSVHSIDVTPEPAKRMEPPPQRVQILPLPNVSAFEDGDGITLTVRPIARFSTVDRITSLLQSVTGVSNVRLRRMHGGVAVFTFMYAGAVPPQTFLPRALVPVWAQVTASGERRFEVEITQPGPDTPGAR